ncbi:MAG: hypothetical protein JNK11_03660, partial [Alphaproteobacteria bacterium]|nr:hypothetical protein [Alphaproteobacteria bacterium]
APHLPGGKYASPVSGVVRAGRRLYLSAQMATDASGAMQGLGDPAAQADHVMRNIKALIEAAGGSLKHVGKLTTSIIDRAHRKAVYETIGRHLQGVYPVSTGLVVNGLARPEALVQVDVEAMLSDSLNDDGTAHERIRRYGMPQWFGQQIDWQGCMIVRAPDELFIRGQTGSMLDGSRTVGEGRRPEDAGAQADLALQNLATLLKDAGASMSDVLKITVFVQDRAYREAVYPMIGKHFRGIHPVSTGIVMTAFARPELLFEIDAVAIPGRGKPHDRFRKYHSSAAKYGLSGQRLDCDFCMAVRAGKTVVLRGQTGVDLNEKMQGMGDARAQADQAMKNVRALLADAGARMEDVVKATLYVTDRAYLAPAAEAVLKHLDGVRPAFSQMVVKGLAGPELLMEVDITAVVP